MTFSRIAAIISVFSIVFPASAQVPVISTAGIVNGASWSTPAAPGGIISIFGTNLAATEQSASGTPLPTMLGGTSVTISGIPAPLFYVSPQQINAQVPASVALSTGSSTGSPGQLVLTGAQAIVHTAAGASSPGVVTLTPTSPGLFTADQSGCGQAAALNIGPDGSVSVNSPSNSAAPGDYIAVFGTGFGLAAQQPPDGTPASSAASLQSPPRVSLDGALVPNVSYAGLAPSLVGVDQINFQIPASTRNGCAVPVFATGFLGSQATISIQNGGGQCTDPPTQSYGQISFSKNFLSEPGPIQPTSPTEYFSAIFPSGPNVQAPAASPVVFAPAYAPNGSTVQVVGIISPGPLTFHSCTIPGFSDLSAGAIQLQPPSGAPITVQPATQSSGGVSYSQSLPSGFIAPGTYTISGTAGSPIGLMATLQIGSPIQLQTAFPSGTAISNSQPLMIQWTGGDAESLVRITLNSTPSDGMVAEGIYSYARATAGSMTINPTCSSAGTCSFGLTPSAGLQVAVQVVPDPVQFPPVVMPGVTGPVQLSWSYAWEFSGLTVAP